jgi:hypothetical protein
MKRTYAKFRTHGGAAHPCLANLHLPLAWTVQARITDGEWLGTLVVPGGDAGDAGLAVPAPLAGTTAHRTA